MKNLALLAVFNIVAYFFGPHCTVILQECKQSLVGNNSKRTGRNSS